MKFYDCATAPSPRRVRIFLAEKGRRLDLSRRPVLRSHRASLLTFGHAVAAPAPRAATQPSRRAVRQTPAGSLDDLVGSNEQHIRNWQPKLFRRFEIDGCFVSCRRLHR